MSHTLKPFLYAKVMTLMSMIDKSDKNWRFYIYHQDDYDVYDELDRQLKMKYKDQVKAIYSGCDSIHNGQYCDGAHGDEFTFMFLNRNQEEFFDLSKFVKAKND